MRMRPLSEISAPIIRSTVRSYDRRPVRSAQSSFTCVSIDGLEANIAISPEGSLPSPLQRMSYNINKFDG